MYQGDIEECRSCALLPVEVRGGAHDHERREGAVATGHERMSPNRGRDLRETIVDRCSRSRTGISGIGLRGRGGVLPGLLAHNLKDESFLRHLRGEVCPKFGKRAAWA